VRQRVKVKVRALRKLCFHPVLACVMQPRSLLSPLSFLSSLLAFLFMLREIFDGYGLRHICFAAALRRNHFFFQMCTSSHPTSVSLKGHP